MQEAFEWSDLFLQVATISVIIGYAIQASRSARATEKSVNKSMDETKPHLYPYLEGDEQIVIKNYGKVPALNVTISFDPPLLSLEAVNIFEEAHFPLIPPEGEVLVRFSNKDRSTEKSFNDVVNVRTDDDNRGEILGEEKISDIEEYTPTGKLKQVTLAIEYYPPGETKEENKIETGPVPLNLSEARPTRNYM